MTTERESLMGDRPLDLIGDRKCAKCGFSLWLHGSDLGCPEQEPGLEGCVCPGPDTCAGPPCDTAYWRHV